MAISRNPRSPPRFPEFAQAVRYGVPGTPELLTPPRNSAPRRTTPVAPGAPVGWPSAAIRVLPLVSPSLPKQLGMVFPELRRHRATIAQLGVIVAITVEDYYAQGEAVLAAAPRKNVKEHEMLRLYPAGGTDQGFGVSLEHEDGDTGGGRGRCWEMSAYTSAARHAAKCAESGRTRNVA